VTKLNKDSILKIGQVLPDGIFKWRIFQFRAEGRAMHEKEKFEVSDIDFENICEKIENKKLGCDVQCVSNKDKKFYGSYYLV